MKREIIDKALYNVVKLIDIDGKIRIGWLVPNGKKYSILPLDTIWKMHNFSATNIKSIQYCSNGVFLK